MSLIEHAKLELELSGAGDDYDGMIGEAVLELVDVFSKQGHSGYSAHVVRIIFNELAAFKPLGPITSDPEEWMDVAEQSGYTLYQNRRKGTCFSHDGGKTYYDIAEPLSVIRSTALKLHLPKVSRVKIRNVE